MKKHTLLLTIIISLLTVANVQAESGGMGGMHLSKAEDKAKAVDTTVHHSFRGSALHENAANAHRLAAEQHKKAAAMYRKNVDLQAEEHANAAISFSIDAMGATAATKAILHH